MTCGASGEWTIGSRRKVSGVRSGQRVKAILAVHSVALREQGQAGDQAIRVPTTVPVSLAVASVTAGTPRPVRQWRLRQ